MYSRQIIFNRSQIWITSRIVIATDAEPKLKKAISAPKIMGWRMRLSVRIFLNLADIFFEGREAEDDARKTEKEWT